jgi:hypothetical protein
LPPLNPIKTPFPYNLNTSILRGLGLYPYPIITYSGINPHEKGNEVQHEVEGIPTPFYTLFMGSISI